MDKTTEELILLNMIDGVGSIRLHGLLKEFKSPSGILDAGFESLAGVKGIGKVIAGAISTARSKYDINKELELIRDSGAEVITFFDKRYPENLKDIYDPPVLLYVKGILKPEDKLSVAIVGSRRCTQYGLNTAERIAAGLAFSGITVVSGLARGIDTAAHKGALKNGGRTIAVLGNGLCSVYPPENKSIADDIIKNGAVISEFPMEMLPHKQNFPCRNRIISGISKGVLVVEAAEKSGALITADFAAEQGRDVFAVPGEINKPSSSGTNKLIRDGAKLIESVDDIIEELGIERKRDVHKEKGQKILSGAHEQDIYDMLSDEPCDIDTIAEGLSLKSQQATTALLKMELKGIIRQLPGRFLVLTKTNICHDPFFSRELTFSCCFLHTRKVVRSPLQNIPFYLVLLV